MWNVGSRPHNFSDGNSGLIRNYYTTSDFTNKVQEVNEDRSETQNSHDDDINCFTLTVPIRVFTTDTTS